jgi:hypothetical protein
MRPRVNVENEGVGAADSIQNFLGWLLPAQYAKWRRGDRLANKVVKIVDERYLILLFRAATCKVRNLLCQEPRQCRRIFRDKHANGNGDT